jgi:CDGSH-type Zn-finger protein
VSGVVVLREGGLHREQGGPTVRACPRGPWLVRGADGVETEDGTVHAATRPVVAVCACDKSQRLPWCDGTHKVLRRPTVQDATSSPTKTPTA